MTRSGTARTFWATALVTIFLFGYLGAMGWRAYLLFREGNELGAILGFGVMLLPVVGLWVIVATLREAITHQRLAHQMRESGLELDLSGYKRLPSGKLESAAAKTLVEQLQHDADHNPGDWKIWYRLARGQDAAGNRSAARVSMRHAVDLEREERVSK